MHLLPTCILNWRKSFADPVYFLIFLLLLLLFFLVGRGEGDDKWRITFKGSLGYWILRMEEKIHTKTVVDVSRGGVFWSFSAWVANDMPGKNVCLEGLEYRRNLCILDAILLPNPVGYISYPIVYPFLLVTHKLCRIPFQWTQLIGLICSSNTFSKNKGFWYLKTSYVIPYWKCN